LSVAHKADKGKGSYGADHGVKVGKKMRIDKISEWVVRVLLVVCCVFFRRLFQSSPLIPLMSSIDDGLAKHRVAMTYLGGKI
jgi:hypothetical protein